MDFVEIAQETDFHIYMEGRFPTRLNETENEVERKVLKKGNY